MKKQMEIVNRRIQHSGRLPEPPAFGLLIDKFIKWASEKTRNQAFINDYIDLMKINNGLQYNGSTTSIRMIRTTAFTLPTESGGN
ncbi:hypothetical protein [Bhargavaea massiliensis]|uniref:hypothetical protein n=1 Tax=Bhargavaea massiliensis TaxID=2697500 RepID=UPI001BCD85DD|nr:hypothetical protein [Bhargavaea massiliensis]